jgi:hypothetical protein
LKVVQIEIREQTMANTVDYEVKKKHRKQKNRRRRRQHESLANAKKKTLEALHKLGRLPKSLFHRIGL